MKSHQISTKVNRFAVLFALSIASGLTLIGCSFKVSTATLENVKTCSEVDHGKECTEDMNTFDRSAAQLFATADLKYAPEGTNVTINWNYLGGEAGAPGPIDSVNLETASDTTLVTSSLTAPSEGLPSGDYEVVFSLDTDNAEPIHKQFSVADF